MIPQGLLAGVLLWLKLADPARGWNVWGLGIAASCYCLFCQVLYCTGCSIPMARHAERCAAPGALWCCWCWGSSAA